MTPPTASTPSTASRRTSSRRAGSRAADRTAHRPLRPLTIDHWRAWASLLVLDSYATWVPEGFQLEVVDEVLRGASQLWLVLPEGNAKTTLMSGLALYHGDHVQDASVPMAASSRDQCGLLLNQAAGFVHRTPGLERRFRVFEGYREIRCLRTGGKIKVFAADDRTGDGIIFTLALMDEMHRHRNLALWRTWQGKQLKRGGQMAGISTAGEPGSEFEVLRQKLLTESRDVTRDGAHTRVARGGMVLHDYAVPTDGNVEDLEQVKAANPLAAITVEALAAKRAMPAMTDAHWRRFVCDQAVRGDHAAIGEQEWARAARTGDGDGIPAGQPTYAGLDVGWKWDTTAVVPVWVPTLERRVIGAADVIVPPRDGSSLSPEVIHAALRRLHDRNPIEVLVVDGAVGGEILASWAEDNLGCRVVVHSNGHAAQCLAFERWMEGLREGSLEHPADPDLTQHVLNARARVLPDGRSRFDRPTSTRSAADLQDQRVIDALSAASGAHSVAVGDLRAALDVPAFNVADYRIDSL